MLGSFMILWLFFPQHVLQESHTSQKHRSLEVVFLGCLVMIAFHLIESWMGQAGIWINEVSPKISFGYLIGVSIAATFYLVSLSYNTTMAYFKVSKSTVPFKNMSADLPKRDRHQKIHSKITVTMLTTVLFAFLTVSAFIVCEAAERINRWHEDRLDYLDYCGPLKTVVYGLWHIYLSWMLALHYPLQE